MSTAMPIGTVLSIFPDIQPYDREFAVYALAIFAWPVLVTWLLVSWIHWKGAMLDMLPLGPIKVGLRKASMTVVLAVALILALGHLLIYLGFKDTSDTSILIAYLMHTPMAGLTLAGGAFAAPVAEELMFRGFLQSALSSTRLGFWGSAASISLLFGALHGYSWMGNLYIAAAGILFSLILRVTGSLWPCILAHALTNLILLLEHAAAPYPTS